MCKISTALKLCTCKTNFQKKDVFVIHTSEEWGRWLIETVPLLSVNGKEVYSFEEVEQSFNDSGAGDFQHFINSEAFEELKENGCCFCRGA